MLNVSDNKIKPLKLFSLQVVLEGIRGPGIEGDIAIDDVTLEEGECRAPPPSEYHLIPFIVSSSSGLQLLRQPPLGQAEILPEGSRS